MSQFVSCDLPADIRYRYCYVKCEELDLVQRTINNNNLSRTSFQNKIASITDYFNLIYLNRTLRENRSSDIL